MAENKPTNRERLREITDGIEQGIKELFESEKYMRYLSVMSRFHRYSVNNTMLIYMQKPDATLVAGYNKWKDQFERHVKKGEHGITIIAPTPYKKKIEEQKLDPDTKAPILDKDGKIVTEEKEIEIPMFRPVKVFDVSQTDGKPLPELASSLSGNVPNYEAFMEACLLYTSSAQAELARVFAAQYQLTLTEEVEIRYRTETSTDPETGETTSEEVPYEYYILNVKLASKPISAVVSELLTPEQMKMYQVYRQTMGNKPLLFGGGSPDTSGSEDLSGVQFINGTRPGNPQLVELAKRQVGNVGGYPYWSWYGFDSRVEWCACFVSWCYMVTMCMYLQIQVRKKLSLSEISHLQKKVYMHLR